MTVREKLPWLGPLLESPGYEAVTFTLPPVDQATVTMQLVPETVQVSPDANVTAPLPL